jgi:hypothetical protein
VVAANYFVHCRQPSVWYDPMMKKWRAWYSTFTSCAQPQKLIPSCDNEPRQCGSAVPNKRRAMRGAGLLYAESDDGVSWYKPNLNMTEWKGNKHNNLIQLNGMTTQIYLDESATNVSER